MGVPAFFKWLLQRYPTCKYENQKVFNIDNLYIDLNCVIHQCCRNAPGSPVKPEDQMFTEIWAYIQTLISYVAPNKIVYLAIDGTAPRAKMNQQRQRRYRGAADRTEADFDSNQISPGTEFMVRLSTYLQDRIHENMKEVWNTLSFIYSDSSVPGEGEHKLINFIRQQRAQPDYNPNTVHCLFGPDADLLFLMLATHEPHFFNIRESMQSDFANPSFTYVRMSIIRDYLREEFKRIPGLDLDRAIDDFVLYGIFLGNDFLPNIPGLHIEEGAIDGLIEIYCRYFEKHKEYLTKGQEIQWLNMRKFLDMLSKVEDLWCKKRNGCLGEDIPTNEPYKDKYYMKKFGVYLEDLSELKQKLADEYLKGVDWVYRYYHSGCNDFSWFYPFHYPPFSSEFSRCTINHFEFDKIPPIPVYMQQMSIFPPSA